MARVWVKVFRDREDPQKGVFFQTLEPGKCEQSLQPPPEHVTWATVFQPPQAAGTPTGMWYWWNMDNNVTMLHPPQELLAQAGFPTANPANSGTATAAAAAAAAAPAATASASASAAPATAAAPAAAAAAAPAAIASASTSAVPTTAAAPAAAAAAAAPAAAAAAAAAAAPAAAQAASTAAFPSTAAASQAQGAAFAAAKGGQPSSTSGGGTQTQHPSATSAPTTTAFCHNAPQSAAPAAAAAAATNSSSKSAFTASATTTTTATPTTATTAPTATATAAAAAAPAATATTTTTAPTATAASAAPAATAANNTLLPWFQQKPGEWKFQVHHCGPQVQDMSQGTATRPRCIQPATPGVGGYWIRVMSASRPYFWDPVRGQTCAGIWCDQVQWHAYKAENGAWFYWDVRRQVSQWNLPHEPAAVGDAQNVGGTWMKVGMTVQANLPKKSRYSKSCGEIVSIDQDSVSMQIQDELGGTVLTLKQESIRPCPEGTWVTIRGLKTSGYNDRLSRVFGHTAEGRYEVCFDDGSKKSIKFENCEAASRIWNLKFDVETRWLKPDSEQDGHFLDSRGNIRRFKFQLPKNWGRTNSGGGGGGGGVEAWPMLIWMHGGGGGSFFGEAKKILNLPGLQCAHEKFVVVSPQCEWSWEQRPDPWVAELVEYLRKASWVDPARIYCAGSSMGGMGTLMLGSSLPHVFAALAPCASHHNKACRDEIVAALAEMPLCFLHSPYDWTCPMANGKPLWAKLIAKNPKVLIWENEEPHSGMRRAGFWESAAVYDWLLAHKTAGD